MLLEAAGPDADCILDQAKARRAEELAQEYARRELEATKLVKELLASSGRTMHDLIVAKLPGKLDEIERIDRLITIAETRRNSSLREIYRRRAVLGVQAHRESRTATGRTLRDSRTAIAKSSKVKQAKGTIRRG
jgi:hypothetical protein